MKDYRLTNCLVLWAAVLATRDAYDFAMAAMACARRYDGNQISPGGPATSDRPAATGRSKRSRTTKY
jgi:hypothetical protein